MFLTSKSGLSPSCRHQVNTPRGLHDLRRSLIQHGTYEHAMNIAGGQRLSEQQLLPGQAHPCSSAAHAIGLAHGGHDL